MTGSKASAVKKAVLLNFVFFAAAPFFPETEGERLFKGNHPQKAAAVLEKELESGAAGADAYNFLGLSYFQLEKYEESIAAFDRGLAAPDTDKKILNYNKGNTYYQLEDFDSAVKSYSAALSVASAFSRAMLNRANAYVKLDKLKFAVEDYEAFLELEPDYEQKSQIEEILAALREELLRRGDTLADEEEEARRFAQIRAEEAERLKNELSAKEQLREQEAERMRQLAEFVDGDDKSLMPAGQTPLAVEQVDYREELASADGQEDTAPAPEEVLAELERFSGRLRPEPIPSESVEYDGPVQEKPLPVIYEVVSDADLASGSSDKDKPAGADSEPVPELVSIELSGDKAVEKPVESEPVEGRLKAAPKVNAPLESEEIPLEAESEEDGSLVYPDSSLPDLLYEVLDFSEQ